MIIQTTDRHAPVTPAFYRDHGDLIDLHTGEVFADNPKVNALYLTPDSVPVKPGQQIRNACYYRYDPDWQVFIAVLHREIVVNLGLWVHWDED